ncbi:MAG: anion permease [Proteobacteria bacterium]|nr:anion permease [Pseudomonadota bacterium]
MSAVIVLLITEWMPLEVIALLVLGVLAVSGIVSPTEALAGFSNPAVVTIWALFILSGGLTLTGIANILGRQLLKVRTFGDHFYGYQYYSHCRPGGAYGANRPENLSQSGNISTYP